MTEINTRVFLGIIIIILFLTGGTTLYLNLSGTINESQGEHVIFQTLDMVKIHGNYYQGEQVKGIILIHMLGEDRNVWNELAIEINNAGYTVLTFDSRGHGSSITQNNKEINWTLFDKNDYEDMVFDLDAAISFLNMKEITNISVVGSSLGGNIALKYLSSYDEIIERNEYLTTYDKIIEAEKNNTISNLVLISPGLNYKEIDTEDAIKDIGNVNILFIVSKEDSGSLNSVQTLESYSSNSEKIIYDGRNHGTEIIKDEKARGAIILWLKEVF